MRFREVQRLDTVRFHMIQKHLFDVSADPMTDEETWRSTVSNQVPKNWLQSVLVATDPTYDLWIFAHRHKVCAMRKQEVVFHLDLGSDRQVAALVAVPFPSKLLSDTRPYDHVGVALGFEDGTVRFYSNLGLFLLETRYAKSPVKEMRISLDQMLILYADRFMQLNYFSLLAHLREKLDELRFGVGRAALGVVLATKETSPSAQAYRLEKGNDCASLAYTGTVKQSLWKRMETAMVRGGFWATLSTTGCQTYETYCSVGKTPFLSFHWNSNSGTGRDRDEMIPRVASDSVLEFAWSQLNNIIGTLKDTSVVRETIDRTNMKTVYARCSFEDSERNAVKVVPSPNRRKLVALSDTFGRVFVVDTKNCLIVRMWKGYRNCQLGWMEVADEKNQNSTVLVLVIYVPKRRIVEFWSVQNGCRIAVNSQATHAGLLVYSAISLFRPTAADRKDNLEPSLRFLASDGTVYLPSLRFENVVRKHGKDEFWSNSAVQRFRGWWPGELTCRDTLDRLISILTAMSSARDARFLVDLVMNCKHVDLTLFLEFLEAVVIRVESLRTADADLIEVSRCHAFCDAVTQVANFYAVIRVLWQEEEDDEEQPVEGETVSDQLFPKRLFAEIEEFHPHLECNMTLRLQTGEYDSLPHGFEDFALLDFLHIFEFEITVSGSSDDSKGWMTIAEPAAFTIKLATGTVDQRKLAASGEFIFRPFLTGRRKVSDFKGHFADLLSLRSCEWIHLICVYWLFQERDYSVDPSILCSLIYSLFCHSNGDQLVSDANRETSLSSRAPPLPVSSNEWDDAKMILLKTDRLAEAVCFCLVVGSIVSALRRQKCGPSEWEVLDTSLAEWDVMFKLLKGLVIIQNLVLLHGISDKWFVDNVNLSGIRRTGFGYFSEAIARVFVHIGSFVFWDGEEGVETYIVCVLRILQRLFPCSMNVKRLLVNYCWQGALHWHRHPSEMVYLECCTKLAPDLPYCCVVISLIWQTFLMGYFQVVCDPINKNDTTVEREFLVECSRRPIVSNGAVARFSRCVYQLLLAALEHLGTIETAGDSSWRTELNEKETDDAVGLFMDSDSLNRIVAEGLEDLVSILSHRPLPDYQNLLLHVQLATTVMMNTQCFQVEMHRLVDDLFAEEERFFFFSKLDRDFPSFLVKDAKMDVRRTDFLHNYIQLFLERYSVDSDELNFWPVVELCTLWNLNFDVMRRRIVIELFQNSLLSLAYEKMHSVEDKAALSRDLLQLAATYVFYRRSTLWKTVVPKFVLTWFESLSPIEFRSKQFDCVDCEKICLFVKLIQLDDGSVLSRVAAELLKICAIMSGAK